MHWTWESPARTIMAGMFSQSVWAELETGFALGLLVLAFWKKSRDSTWSSGSVLGWFSFGLLCYESLGCFIALWDGIWALATNDQPRPLATFFASICMGQQVRVLLQQKTIDNLIHSQPPAPFFITSSDVIHKPVNDIIHDHH